MRAVRVVRSFARNLNKMRRSNTSQSLASVDHTSEPSRSANEHSSGVTLAPTHSLATSYGSVQGCDVHENEQDESVQSPNMIVNISDEDEMGCPICLESITPKCQARCKLPCGHIFHAKCMMEVRTCNSCAHKCPMCRADLPEKPDDLFFQAMTSYCDIERKLLQESAEISWGDLPQEEGQQIQSVLALFELSAQQGGSVKILVCQLSAQVVFFLNRSRRSPT
jgi:hypothetical protein